MTEHLTPEAAKTPTETAQHTRDIEFITLMAHDLRQPLSVMLGMGTLLESHWDELPDASKREHVALMMRSTKWMKALVDDLMASEASEANRTPPVAFSVEELVSVVIHDLDPKYGCRLTLHAGTDLPLGYGDPIKQRKVLQNLLDNAIKYSATSTPIDIWLTARDGMVVVTVADRGLGISTADAHRIFDKYVRLADSEDHQTIEGSGLGLYLVKAMVDAEGGEIDVETNTNGVGSVFTYTLPAAP